MEHDTVRILLVEDNPIDVRATLRAARKLAVVNTVDVVIDGDQAMAYLADPERARPDLVLLDLNLPGRDGHDVLKAMKTSDRLRRIPIVVLTTSTSDADVLAAYDSGANAYVKKPVDLAGWQATMAKIEDFWFTLVKLPPT